MARCGVRRLGLLVVVALAVCVGVLHARASRRVAFMGDSLTQGWSVPRENFGVHGQTTGQMLERFGRQVPGHGVVVILGGTNDTLLGLGQAETLGNLAKMVDLARAEGAEPVLGEVPPIYRGGGVWMPAVRSLDAGIVRLGAAKGVKVVDYFGALDGEEKAYSDGVHLKRRGYLRMEWALVRAVWVF